MYSNHHLKRYCVNVSRFSSLIKINLAVQQPDNPAGIQVKVPVLIHAMSKNPYNKYILRLVSQVMK